MSDVAVYHVFVCALFPVQGGMWTGIASPHTSLHWKQRTPKEIYAATSLIVVEDS